MAGVSEFWSDIIGIAPVDGSLGGSAEEMSWISSKRNGCNCSHNIGLFLHVHLLRSNLGESTITSTKKKITIGEEVDAVDTLGKQFLVWSNSFEEVIGKRNFYNISSLGSKVSIGISGVNNTACEHSLNLIHENFSILNFFEDKVAVPCSDTIVVDSEAFGRGVVEETNSVCNVHSNWISNKSFSTDNLFWKK